MKLTMNTFDVRFIKCEIPTHQKGLLMQLLEKKKVRKEKRKEKKKKESHLPIFLFEKKCLMS